MGTVAHALASSVRRRRRDLAIFKTLGFVRGQVSATVAWQATTFALVAVLVGLPLGIAAGRWAWRLTAEQLGVASPPVTPPLLILAIATGAVVAANLIAAPRAGSRAASGRPLCCIRSSRSHPYDSRHQFRLSLTIAKTRRSFSSTVAPPLFESLFFKGYGIRLVALGPHRSERPSLGWFQCRIEHMFVQESAKRRCSFPGCGRPHLAKGLCRGHYEQQRHTSIIATAAFATSR